MNSLSLSLASSLCPPSLCPPPPSLSPLSVSLSICHKTAACLYLPLREPPPPTHTHTHTPTTHTHTHARTQARARARTHTHTVFLSVCLSLSLSPPPPPPTYRYSVNVVTVLARKKTRQRLRNESECGNVHSDSEARDTNTALALCRTAGHLSTRSHMSHCLSWTLPPRSIGSRTIGAGAPLHLLTGIASFFFSVCGSARQCLCAALSPKLHHWRSADGLRGLVISMESSKTRNPNRCDCGYATPIPLLLHPSSLSVCALSPLTHLPFCPSFPPPSSNHSISVCLSVCLSATLSPWPPSLSVLPSLRHHPISPSLSVYHFLSLAAPITFSDLRPCLSVCGVWMCDSFWSVLVLLTEL